MRSRLRRRLAGGIVAALPLAFAGCSAMQQAFYEADPASFDRPDFNAALDAQRRGDDAAAARAYQRLYNYTKLPMAEVQLGRRYAEGQGVPKDTAKALQLLQSAYDKDWSGRAEAAYYLGRMYDDGNGVPQDKQKAFEQTVADEIQKFPGVAAVSEPAQNEAGDITVVQVTPKSGPAADETKDLVSYMRNEAEQIPSRTASTRTSRVRRR